MRLSTYKDLIGQGIKGVWRNRMMSFASFCILIVSLLLVGLTMLLALNLNRAIDSMESKNEIVVIINEGTEKADMDSLGKRIEALANVQTCKFFSRDQAWKEMVADMTDEEKDLFEYADKNPLPDTYRVTVYDIETMGNTTVQLSALENVESVEAPSEYADVLISIRNILTLVSVAIVAALVIVCLIIISNTTRASVFSRRKEINIMRYVGATNAFIRVPFFIEGMLVGIVAGVGAFFLTKFAYVGIYNVLTGLNILSALGINTLYSFDSIAKYIALAYIAAGAAIGAVGTTISTKKYCRV